MEKKQSAPKKKPGILYVLEMLLLIVFGDLLAFPALIFQVLIPKFPELEGMLTTCLFYYKFIGIWILFFLLYGLWKKQRPMLTIITPKFKGNTVIWLLVGLVLGFVQNGACILSAYLHHDIELSFGKFNIAYLLLIFVGVFIQSAAEELACRGVLYRRFEERYNKPWLTILVSGGVFGVLHLANPGVTPLAIINIIIVGMFYALIVYITDSLWCAFAAHAAWNFTQNIIFGLPNSGEPSLYSVFVLNADTAKNSFFYDNVFGVEGTAFATILLAVSCAVLFLIRNKIGCKERYDLFTGTYREEK